MHVATVVQKQVQLQQAKEAAMQYAVIIMATMDALCLELDLLATSHVCAVLFRKYTLCSCFTVPRSLHNSFYQLPVPYVFPFPVHDGATLT